MSKSSVQLVQSHFSSMEDYQQYILNITESNEEEIKELKEQLSKAVEVLKSISMVYDRPTDMKIKSREFLKTLEEK